MEDPQPHSLAQGLGVNAVNELQLCPQLKTSALIFLCYTMESGQEVQWKTLIQDADNK